MRNASDNLVEKIKTHTAHLPQHRHNSKSVIFQERILQVFEVL